MALKPVLKTKVDELFLRWLSDGDVQTSLRENLLQISRGEHVTGQSVSGGAHSGSSRPGAHGQRGHNSSSIMSGGSSPKLPSPRSPRRPLANKRQVNDSNKPSLSVKDKDYTQANGNVKEGGVSTGQTTPVIRDVIKVKDGKVTEDIRALQPQELHNKDLHPATKLPAEPSPPNAGKQTSKSQDTEQKASVRSPPVKAATSNDVRENKENKPKKRPHVAPRSPSTAQHIPPFYFPRGRPAPTGEVEAVLGRLQTEFSTLEAGKAYKQQMPTITKACGIPVYWKILLFRAAGGATEGFITYQSVAALIKRMYQNCHDDASKFVRLAAKSGSQSLEFDDFEPLIQDVVETHPGLTFLQDAPEFHSRYVTTVISRIMFCVNRSWSGRITVPEIRKSCFLQTLNRLESEEDINQVKDFFSYEHFYVIYCKFWELDKDHDLYIDKNDLARHNDHALNSRLIDRIFSGAVTRGQDFEEGRMSYREFVWFLLAEEDKKHMTSIEYWFRCMDLDGDGVISMYEMEFFHEEQMNKMETLGIERLPFEDTVCQMMDMVSPSVQGRVALRDLKHCKMTSIFFDTFFNLDKFLDHEQRDPFANARDPNAEVVEVSDWNKYAEEEYDILVADEGNADMDEGNYEDDFEPEDDDEILREEMLRLADAPVQRGSPATSQDDIYDFSSSTNLGY